MLISFVSSSFSCCSGFFFSSRRRHTRSKRDWSSDVCSSDLLTGKVVVDAMGSDRAPHPEIDGALAATRDFGVGVILVGPSEIVVPELRRCGWRRDGDKGVEFVEAPEFIRMDEAVANAVRRKRKSSMRVGARLVAEG